MIEEYTLIDMMKNSNKSMKETILSFQEKLQSDIKLEFKLVSRDIKELDEKVQKNTISTATELAQIKEKVNTLIGNQKEQEELIDEIRIKQLQCPASNNWEMLIGVVDKHNVELKTLDEDITGIHAIEKLKRSSNYLNKKTLDLPRWLPLVIALLTAAGIIGGAAAIKLARSDSLKLVVPDQVSEEIEILSEFGLDIDYYTGDVE